MEILNYKSIMKGCLLGKFDIVIPEWGALTIHECTVFQKEGKRWIALPSKEYQAKDGQKKHYGLIKFDMKVFEKLQAAALSLLEKLMAAPPPSKTQENNNDPAALPF